MHCWRGWLDVHSKHDSLDFHCPSLWTRSHLIPMPWAIASALEEWAQQIFHWTLDGVKAGVALLLPRQDFPRLQAREDACGELCLCWLIVEKGRAQLFMKCFSVCLVPPLPPEELVQVLSPLFGEWSTPVPHGAIAAFMVYQSALSVKWTASWRGCVKRAISLGDGLHFPPKSMENWLFAPDPSGLAESSRIKLPLPRISGMKAVVKTKLCFTQICLLKYLFGWHELSDCIYFNFVCSKKKSAWREKAKRFLLFEILHSPLAPFRVPHSSCVWFSFVSSCYQHP